jgi:hypothetical protein
MAICAPSRPGPASHENAMCIVLWEKRLVDPNARRPQTLEMRERRAEPPPNPGGRPRMPAAPLAIGRAYERFLELPVAVVLVVLWLLGALILGAVVMGGYSAVVWLSAAIASL